MDTNQIRWRAIKTFLVTFFIERVVFALLVILLLRHGPITADTFYGGLRVFLGLATVDILYGRIILTITTISLFPHIVAGKRKLAFLAYLTGAALPWTAILVFGNVLNPLLRGGDLIFEKPILYHVVAMLLGAWFWSNRVTVKNNLTPTGAIGS
jgi:hypothetical protein